LAVSDQDPEATATAWLAEFRELIGGSVHHIIDEYATQINLRCVSKQQQLENDVIGALIWCLEGNVQEPTRKHDRKRDSHAREDLRRVAREAEAAEKHLERLRAALNNLSPRYAELLNANLESVVRPVVSLVAKQVPWFHALSQVADTASAIARVTRDKGGASKMLAFRFLVGSLKRAFERATGRSAGVTWNPVQSRYEGDFINLVEAVVPVALSLVESANRRMRIPGTEYARGRYIDRMTGGKGPKKRKA
jgi:hypothetical protein